MKYPKVKKKQKFERVCFEIVFCFCEGVVGCDDFATVQRGGISWLWVVTLVLGGNARALHTPGPSREGRFEMLVSICE